jgi:predicted acyl esterase
MTTSFIWMQVLCQLDKFYGKDNEFWQQLKDHSSYDDFWRGILQHLKDIKPAMTGGWFDAEDLYGPLNTYQAIEKQQKLIRLLWGHGVMVIGPEIVRVRLLVT